MPPPATGTVRYNAARGCYQTRLRYKGGKRIWVDLPKGLSRTQADARSRSWAKDVKNMAPPAPRARAIAQLGGETVRAYFARYCDARTRRGIVTVYDDRCRFDEHIDPIIGHKLIAHITEEEIEDLRDKLDEKAQAGHYFDKTGRRRSFGRKTAQNVWTIVTSLFDSAKRGRPRDLRVRTDNPAKDVETTERSKRKSKQFLFPSELLTLVACPVVPIHWRHGYAISVYLYLRVGELEVLTWDDVDIEHRIVSINKARQSDGTIGSPKNEEPRRVPIPDTLVPLLSFMRRVAGGKGLVAAVPGGHGRAETLRVHLKRAGVTRSDLFARDATRTPMTFHDLRATGITWRAVRNDPPFEIKDDAGHKSVTTTEKYIRDAGPYRRGFGEVFPLLPESILQTRSVTRSVTSERQE